MHALLPPMAVLNHYAGSHPQRSPTREFAANFAADTLCDQAAGTAMHFLKESRSGAVVSVKSIDSGQNSFWGWKKIAGGVRARWLN